MLHPHGVPRCSPRCQRQPPGAGCSPQHHQRGRWTRKVPKPGGGPCPCLATRVPGCTRVPTATPGARTLDPRIKLGRAASPPPYRHGAGPGDALCPDWPLMYESGAPAGEAHVVAGDPHVLLIRWFPPAPRRQRSMFGGRVRWVRGGGRPGAPRAAAGSASCSWVGEFVPLWAQTKSPGVEECGFAFAWMRQGFLLLPLCSL